MQIRAIRKGKGAVVLLAAISLISLLAAACGGDSTTSTPTPANTAPKSSASVPASSPTAAGIPADVGKNDSGNVTGAGATFPQVIYTAWFDDYNKKVAKGVQVNYQGVGSGAGINQFTANTVDFGASDVGMTDAQIAKASDVQLLPTVIGSVTLTYNIPGVTGALKFDGPVIANIYLGNIKKWNDPAITVLNPGVNLPGNDIQVVYRSDSSGTSGVFTDYLSKVSPEWQTKVGSSTAPKWPVGQGGQGNPGVANAVKQTPNAIGFVELTYALQNKLGYADVKNKAGKFITPTIDSASASAAGVTLPADYRASITDAPGDTAYPISTFTYLLLYKSTGKCTAQTPLVDMLWWVYHDPAAIQAVKDNSYSPLPANLLPRIEATLKSLKCDGGAKSSLKTG